MAQCAVHALKGLACRAPVLLVHAEVTENIKYFSIGPKLRHPAVPTSCDPAGYVLLPGEGRLHLPDHKLPVSNDAALPASRRNANIKQAISC